MEREMNKSEKMREDLKGNKEKKRLKVRVGGFFGAVEDERRVGQMRGEEKRGGLD